MRTKLLQSLIWLSPGTWALATETTANPKALLRATGTRAGGASDALAHSAHQKLLSPLCCGGEGGLWGQPAGQAAVQSLLPVCGCMAAVKQGSHSPPGGLQLVRQGDSSLFLCVSHGVVGGLGQG